MRRHARVLFVVAALASFFAIAGTASAEYEHLGTFSSEGTGDGELAKFPGHAAVEQSTGNLFVVDQGNNRVQVFKPNGSGADYLTQFGSGLSAPWGIAIDENAGQTFVYVADAGNDQILKYASDEAATPSFSVDGTFSLAAGKVGDYKAALAIDPTTHDLLVADHDNNLIERFKSDGSFVSSFDGTVGGGSPGAFAGPLDVAVNSTGDVYVIDEQKDIVFQTGTSQALRYSAAGAYKAALSPVGPDQRPATVAVNPSTDEVLVSGQQDAVYRDQSPSLHFFDSDNAPLPSPTLEDQHGSVSGLAIAGDTGKAYVVLYPGLYGGSPYSGTPQIQVFVVSKKPALTIAPISEANAQGAELTGTVNPKGSPTEWHFEYSSDGGGTWISTPVENAGSGNSPVAVSAEINGLIIGASYQVRLTATNSEGSKTSEIREFTPQTVKGVNTGEASNRTLVSATLNGTINPGGIELTQCQFEYGKTTAYGNTVPCVESNAAIGSGDTPVPVHADVSGLEVANYHFRLVAANVDGVTNGKDAGFSLIALPIVSDQAFSISYPEATYAEATLRGKINPGNGKTSYHFEYGLTASYGQSTADRDLAAGTTTRDVNALIAPLDRGASYHFRLVATNATGTTSGADQTFTTLESPPVDACPNAAIRAKQGAAKLAECRAFELVSPSDKGNIGVNPRTTVQSSPSGTGVAFSSVGAFAGNQTSTLGAYYVSRRGAGGWSTEGIDAPQSSLEARFANTSLFLSDDLSKTAQISQKALVPGAIEYGSNLYLRDNVTGTQALIGANDGFGMISELAPAGTSRHLIAASRDLSHFVFSTIFPLLPGLTPGIGHTYEYADGELRLVGLLPDGSIAPNGSSIGSPAEAPRPVSADGSRIVFYDAGSPIGNTGIYMRIDGNKTIPISASHRAIDSGTVASGELFGMSADGNHVFFTSRASLVEGSDTSGYPHLYRYDVDEDQLTDLTVPRHPGDIVSANIPLYTSASGAYSYFMGRGDITGEDVRPGMSPVYVAHGDQLQRGPEISFFGEGRPSSSSISPSGRYLAFVSRSEVTANETTGPDCEEGGACSEVYLYDAVSDSTRCLSCQPVDGVNRPAHLSLSLSLNEEAISQHASQVVGDDGSVAFESAARLVPEDVNDKIDVYRWHDGELTLVSSGRGSVDANLGDVSRDGRDIFFLTSARLVEADVDGVVDLYDARVEGGIASQNVAARSSSACEGDSCRTAASGAPAGLTASSAAFSGPGNAKKQKKPKRRAACKGKVGKQKKRCHSQAHKKAGKKASKNGRGI